METIRLKNFRCFEDTGEIDLKSLNFVVGANSSGKSSFLKFFPLLKQSIGKRLHGVVAWLGEEVDFKDFKNTVKSGEDRIEIEFTLRNPRVLKIRRAYALNGFTSVRVRLGIEAVGEHFDQITDMIIILDNRDVIDIDFRNSEVIIEIDGDVYKEANIEVHKLWTNSLLPSLLFAEIEYSENSIDFREIFRAQLKSYGMNVVSTIHFLDNLPMSYDKFVTRLRKYQIPSDELCQFYKKTLFYTLDNIVDSLNAYLMELRDNIIYVKPIRAMFQRYYRYQNVDLEAIESDGSNLPMFLHNQTNKAQYHFRNWLKSNFGIEVYVEPHDTHLELMISDHGKTPRNLVDVGVGYTQILPILAIIWENVYLETPISRIKSVKTKIIVIEQPELHLHPAFQKLFSQMLANLLITFEKEQKDVRLIIETHSETILNEIGNIISLEANKIRDSINVLLTQQDENGNSSIMKTGYTEDGYLENWPINFFDDAF